MRKPKKIKESFALGESEQSTKEFANEQEAKISKNIGGKLTPQSGAKMFMPGDIYLGDNLIDVKSAKTAKQIIVTEDMLKKLELDASLQSKNPVLLLNFPNANKLTNKRWVMIPMKDGKL